MGSMSKNKVFPLVAGAILVVTSVVSGVTVFGQNTAMGAQQAHLDDLTNQVESARSGTGKLETEISLQASGANSGRVAEDTKAIGKLLDRALTWGSHEEYSEARKSTMRVHNLDEDSAFMKSFLPEAPVSKDSQGNEYPYIDAAGLNSSVGDFRAKVLSVDAVSYRYMVLVDVQGKSSDGLGTAVNVATVFVTIDGEGAMTDISGFASTSKPRTSG